MQKVVGFRRARVKIKALKRANWSFGKWSRFCGNLGEATTRFPAGQARPEGRAAIFWELGIGAIAGQSVDCDPFIKSQPVSHNQLYGLAWCKFGHVTLTWRKERRVFRRDQRVERRLKARARGARCRGKQLHTRPKSLSLLSEHFYSVNFRPDAGPSQPRSRPQLVFPKREQRERV